ncbi:serine carboxypeptidase-like 50 [Pyrus ussuriensis x Pyrus communis]|uniref:Carboxypeptidase n=1 Tax=Pyrus ussuriensis x Pyrus communis TaxID=2448454 RepID=A0A5N5H1G2_9ROSA|nr:serine carboxypeptidase-like 50 [Pyrus ussuriensis x Pyrus communis]
MESSARNHLNLLFLLLLFFLRRVAAASSPPLFPKQAHPTKSGYLPVNSTSGSAIFYTFYEAQNLTTDVSKVPLLIWLQGGPGCSSMLANFYELGPWRVNFNKHPSDPLALEPNSATWNRIFGLIFLDNPIGTGFSIAANSAEIPRDQHSVAIHLFAAITKFIELDPAFKTRPMYITGESYAGKYVPAIGHYILKRNAELPAGSKGVNLQGVAIGDGLTDPIIQVNTHAVDAFYSGLINEKQRRQLEKLQLEAVGFTAAMNWSAAADARNRVLDTLQDMTGLATLYDYTKNEPYKMSLVDELLSYEAVKVALGAKVEAPFESCSDFVGGILHEDVMKSVKYMVEYLLKESKVLLYQGQYDLRDGIVSTEAWMKTMKWEGIGKFMAADRKVWKVRGEVAGYVQKWGSLSHVVVSGAGHLLPADQPLRAQVMIEDWVLDKGVFKPCCGLRGRASCTC